MLLIKHNVVVPPVKKAGRPAALKVSRFFAVDADASATTQRLVPRMATTPVQSIQNGHGSGNAAISLTPDNVSQEQDSDDDEVQRRGTWEKIVTYKTPRVPPLVVTPPSLPAVSAPPAGSTPPAL